MDGVAIGIVALALLTTAGLAYAAHLATTPEPCTASEQACSAAAALLRLPLDPASLLPDAQKGSVDAATAIPRGSAVKVKPSTWSPASETSGTIEMTCIHRG